jgi:hypothetical protein
MVQQCLLCALSVFGGIFRTCDVRACAAHAECVEVWSASLKSPIPTKEFGLWDLPTFSTVQHHSYLTAQQPLAHTVNKVRLQ